MVLSTVLSHNIPLSAYRITAGSAFNEPESLDGAAIIAQYFHKTPHLVPKPEEPQLDIEAIYPCTPSQEDILLESTVNKSFWLSVALSLPEHAYYSIDRIRLTWQALAVHNPILRTVLIGAERGNIRQAVLCRVDALRFQPQHLADDGHRLQDDIHKPAHMVYSYAGETDHIVTLHIPRALVDENSLALIRRDFALFYSGKAFSSHIPFSLYVEHVRSLQESNATEYWRQALERRPTGSVFGSSPVRPEVRYKLTATSGIRLVDQLRHFQNVYHVAPRTLLHAAWAIVHSAHTSSESTVFAVTGRDQSFPHSQSIIGRADMSYLIMADTLSDMTVLDTLRFIQEADKNGSVNGFIGYRKIVGSLPATSKIETIVTVVEGLRTPIFDGCEGDFAIGLHAAVTDVLRVTLCCPTSVQESRSHILLQHVMAALQHMLSHNPEETNVNSVNLLSDDENRLLLDFSRPYRGPQPDLIHVLFERQVEQEPNSIAIQFEDEETITFTQLNQLANRIARSFGAKCSGAIIPVCMDRSILFVASLLAVMKVGAGYVTLDPDNPASRNRFIESDVGAPFVLTHEKYASRFENVSVVSIESLPTLDSNLGLHQSTDTPAYVIYTSGSTGKPKGVLVNHRAATNGIAAFPGRKGLRSLLFYNPVFSAAQRTIFATLVHGGCLCLASKETLTLNLSGAIRFMNVNTIGLTSSTAVLLDPSDVPSIKQITVTGELIDPELVQRWARHNVELRNAYGLSENAQLVWGSSLKVGTDPRNIGRPRDTTTSYVLIPGTKRLSPLRVPGELCLGGGQLAQSYFNRPEDTQKAFIENPFGQGKLYRTGDMAVRLEDGSIVIVGRIDFQVKINGQRVEPGEIKSVLDQHWDVLGAAVIAASVGGKKVLVAGVVPKDHGSWLQTVGELRKLVHERLPSYMVPAFWMPLEEIPKNQNGKVDVPLLRRRAETLGQDALLNLSRERGNVEPDENLTEIEVLVRNAWKNALEIRVEQIGLQNSFMELGGSSLQAMRVTTQLREQGFAVQLADVIQLSSLKELAESAIPVDNASNTEPEPFSLIPTTIAEETKHKIPTAVDAYPSTPLQDAIVASSMQNKETYVYRRVFRLSNNVDIHKLKDAFTTVVQNTPILRTTFVENGTTFLQVVRETSDIDWVERTEELEDYAKADTIKGMELGEQLLRFAILKNDLLVVTMHHALFDYWCHSFIFEDATKAYHGSTLTQRPSFSRFIKHVLGSNLAETKDFWKTYLDSAPPCRIATVPHSEKHRVCTTLKLDISSFSSAYGVTIGAMIYAAWSLVLAAQTRNDDVTFATTLSGREAAIDNIHLMNGPTLTTVPQRIEIDRELSRISFVRKVQSDLWKMTAHAHFGMRAALHAADQQSSVLDTLVNILIKSNPGEDEKKLFQSHGARSRWETEFTMLEVENTTEGLDIGLMSDLEPRRAGFILEQLVNGLNSLISEPEAKVASVELIGRNEWAYLRSLSPPMPTVSGQDLYLHSRFEQTASKFPSKIAVHLEGGKPVSYEDLNTRANRLAAYLRERGVGPDSMVPLCIDKSIDMLVAILGVLKAGGAYVPLDHENPLERNRFIVSDVVGKLALTEPEHADIFLETDCEPISLNQIDLTGFPGHNIAVPNLKPENLAYCIYTSGSTGLPKGVLITHDAVATAIDSIIEVLGCKENWRTIQFSNYVFDVSVSDIFTAFGVGSTLCVAPMSSLLSDLAGCINGMGVTQLFLTPTVAKLISPEDVPQVTTICLAGEQVPANLVELWTKQCRVINCYGPTEASILSIVGDIPKNGNNRIIGQPLRTVSASVLNTDSLELVPYGAIGELCMSGPQLAKCYLNRQEATEQAFVSDGDTKVYRTGDLVRWLPGGQIECFGRKDSQVKIYGHRIELGEIERAVLATGQVQLCLVGVATMQDKKNIVAFCVYEEKEDDGILPADVFSEQVSKTHTSLTTLPPYMIPKFFMPLSRFPLLPSGKTDRKKLIRWAEELPTDELMLYSSASSGSQEMVEPETDEERLLQQLWSEIFCVESSTISAIASFFFFGGDSISAIGLVSKCRRSGFTLAVSDILSVPTLRDMALCLRPLVSQEHVDEEFQIPEGVVTILNDSGVEAGDIQDICPCVPGQIEFLTRGRTDNQFWQLQTVRSIPNDLDFEKWIENTKALTQLNSILRVFYLQHDGEWLQVTLKDAVIDLDVIKCASEDEKVQIINANWEQQFEIGKPAVRYRLLVLPDGSRDILIKLDHASYDGTLLRIFDDQFQAISNGVEPPRHVDFLDYTRWVRHTDNSRALDFWSKYLSGVEFPEPLASQPVTNSVLIRKTGFEVEGFAQQIGVTVPIVFQTAFSILLFALTGKDDVVYDNLLAGRNIDMEDADMINGTVANFLPFRYKADRSTVTVQQILKETQNLFWKTNENGVVGMRDIFAKLNWTRGESSSRHLFLFQPFEPAAGPVEHMRWLVMALSHTIKMPVDYAIMLEVFKTPIGYNVRIKYDNRVYPKTQAESIGDDFLRIMAAMMSNPRAIVEKL